MNPGFIRNPSSLLFNKYGKWVVLEGGLSSLPDLDDSKYSEGMESLYPFSPSVAFEFDNKSWYGIQKALGLVKPVYKKFKKGKRYIYKEIGINEII